MIDNSTFQACGGEVACSTCHVILDEKTYSSLPKPSEEEEGKYQLGLLCHIQNYTLDMLDLAIGLSETSRLGCQVKVTEVR